MKRLLVVLAATLACATALANPAGKLTVEGPSGLLLAPRDSLPYTLRWGKAKNATATSYKVAVTATATPAGTTTGLPNGLVVTDSTASFTAINLNYDSLAFTASVTSLRGTAVGPTTTASWSVVKKPGAPGPIQIDSSAIPPLATTASVRPIYAVISGAQVLQWTSYDTTIAIKCGTNCNETVSWSCPVYPAGSKFGTYGPPGCYPGFVQPTPVVAEASWWETMKHNLNWAIALAQS